MNLENESLIKLLEIVALIISLVWYILLLFKAKGFIRILVFIGLGISILANLLAFVALPDFNLEILDKVRILNPIGTILLVTSTILYVWKAKK